MKAFKQNNNEMKSKKKDVKENGAVPKIQTYFKSAPKSFVVEDKNNNGCIDSQNIYVDALKKKLQDARGVVQFEANTKEDHLSEQASAGQVRNADVNLHQFSKKDASRAVDDITVHRDESVAPLSRQCQRADCVQKALESQEWERKYKELKKVYVNLTINYSEENIKYKNLLKAATRVNHPDSNEVVLSDDGIFTPNEIKALERIALDRPKDSTFILECLQYAYKSDISVLSGKTLKGKGEVIKFSQNGEEIRHDAKDPLTPEKVARIKQLFIDRITKCEIDSVEHGERIKDTNLNKLFASGIKNIAKKQPNL